MIYKRQSIIIHSLQMVFRNYRMYAMLSVTVVLSFSLLFGYLCFTDSIQYNGYKELFKQPGNIVMTGVQDKKEVLVTLDKMVKKVDPTAKKYTYYNYTTQLSQFGSVYANIYFIPGGRSPIYIQQYRFLESENQAWNAATEAELILGKDEFELQKNEAIISENLYESLGTNNEFPFEIAIPYKVDNAPTAVVMLSVVGVCANSSFDSSIQEVDIGCYTGSCTIYTTQEIQRNFFSNVYKETTQNVWFCSEYPEKIADCMNQLSLIPSAICIEQLQARQSIGVQNTNKFHTLLVLLLILGINLFSSFSNALSGRQFEIGVKQAIGASPWNITLQFLLESLMLMIGNTIISVIIVSDILIIYKFTQRAFCGYNWIVYVSPYSMAMYAVCCFSITVLYSGLFAYKSSKVEIIKHLKKE